MKILFLDPDPEALQLDGYCAEKVPNVEVVGSCRTRGEAEYVLRGSDIDLVVMEAELLGSSGISIAKSMRRDSADGRPFVAFVTSSPAFAVEAFDIDAVDYVIKPLTPKRFEQIVERAARRISVEDRHKWAYFRIDGAMHKIYYSDILYIAGMSEYVQLHLRTGSRPLTIHSTMHAMASQLPASLFARIHKSYIVNVGQIDKVKGAKVDVGGTELPIGKTYREAFAQRLASPAPQPPKAPSPLKGEPQVDGTSAAEPPSTAGPSRPPAP